MDNPEEADNQIKLIAGGPVFESGPGWGFYVKKWLKKYFLKVFTPILVIIIAVGIFTARRGTENEKEPPVKETIAVTIIRGDSRALLARKALAEYLKENPEELSNGQKLFIEETLRRKIINPKLVIGEVVEFNVENIESAIAQAKQLTIYQLQAWEELAKKAGIK
jgi:uncharacterized protein YneF (UPF0154 family)